MALVSVVMPSYNHQAYLGAAIDSVLAQTFGDLELIVVDDASRDNSQAIIREKAAADARLRPILHTQNRGIARTFNDGLDAATGRYVGFLCSDDLWATDKLERQVAVLREDEDQVAHSEGMLIDSRGRSTGVLVTDGLGIGDRPKDGQLFLHLLRGNYITPSTMLLRTDHARAFGFDERLVYLNDYKLILQLAHRYPFRYQPEPLLMYRRHANNVTHLRDVEGWSRDARRLLEDILGTHASEIPDDVRAAFIEYQNLFVKLRHP